MISYNKHVYCGLLEKERPYTLLSNEAREYDITIVNLSLRQRWLMSFVLPLNHFHRGRTVNVSPGSVQRQV